MVDGEAREDDVGEINKRLPKGLKLAIVPVGSIELLEKNARFMRNETFRNLVDNIRRDGALTSVPFCCRTPEGTFRAMSGNHRVMAAREAGLAEVLVLYTEADLTREEQVAVQLSHNALAGEDDMAILRSLYEEIEAMELKQYAGLDSKVLDEMEKVALAGLSEANLDLLVVTFAFLPEEIERLKDVLKGLSALPKPDHTILARVSEYDRFLDDLDEVRAANDLTNGATALMILLDVFEQHRGDLEEGWRDTETGEPKHGHPVPLASVLGKDRLKPKDAAVIAKALDVMQARGELDGGDRASALAQWAQSYLAVPKP